MIIYKVLYDDFVCLLSLSCYVLSLIEFVEFNVDTEDKLTRHNNPELHDQIDTYDDDSNLRLPIYDSKQDADHKIECAECIEDKVHLSYSI